MFSMLEQKRGPRCGLLHALNAICDQGHFQVKDHAEYFEYESRRDRGADLIRSPTSGPYVAKNEPRFNCEYERRTSNDISRRQF